MNLLPLFIFVTSLSPLVWGASPTIASRNSIPPGFLVSTPHTAPQNVLAYNPIVFGSSIDGRRLLPGDLRPRPISFSPGDRTKLSPSSSPDAAVIPSTDSRIHYRPESKWQGIKGMAFISRTSKRTRQFRNGETPEDPLEPASISFSFVGRGIRWYGSKSPQHGQAQVLLDGKVVEAQVDAYSPRWLDQQLIYSVDNLRHGRHEIQIVALGTKQRRSEGTAIDLDAFVVLESFGREKKEKRGVIDLVDPSSQKKQKKTKRVSKTENTIFPDGDEL